MVERVAIGIILLRPLLRTLVLPTAAAFSKGTEENVGLAGEALASSWLPLVSWYLGRLSQGQEEGELSEVGDPHGYSASAEPLKKKTGQLPRWLFSLKSGLCLHPCVLMMLLRPEGYVTNKPNLVSSGQVISALSFTM